jgi:hypothetical protein
MPSVRPYQSLPVLTLHCMCKRDLFHKFSLKFVSTLDVSAQAVILNLFPIVPFPLCTLALSGTLSLSPRVITLKVNAHTVEAVATLLPRDGINGQTLSHIRESSCCKKAIKIRSIAPILVFYVSFFLLTLSDFRFPR